MNDYLLEIWGCGSVSDLSPVQAGLILDNAHDPECDFPLDQQVWDAYAAAHGLPAHHDITPAQYRDSAFYRNYVATLKGAK